VTPDIYPAPGQGTHHAAHRRAVQPDGDPLT